MTKRTTTHVNHAAPAPGFLEVHGTLDPNQFWSTGTSDADTLRVQVKRMEFNGKTTHVFDHAQVQGRTRKAVISANGGMTVRLQGIDAPELHYRPDVSPTTVKKPNANFRQPGGREAAEALGRFLRGFGEGEIACRVVSAVASPNDVFDTYGRMIGDVLVTGKHGEDIDVNLWLAEKGWAFPTFYASMTANEIERFQSAADRAKKKRAGVWKHYRAKLSFDHEMLYKDANGASTGEAGPINMPKIFRRLASDWVSTGSTRLQRFLKASAAGDRCYKTSEFLEQGITVAKQYRLDELVTDERVGFGPGEVVFFGGGGEGGGGEFELVSS
jgi:endonuclease YncB( thermonuclease family)